jgi:hypothetical protein
MSGMGGGGVEDGDEDEDEDEDGDGDEDGGMLVVAQAVSARRRTSGFMGSARRW